MLETIVVVIFKHTLLVLFLEDITIFLLLRRAYFKVMNSWQLQIFRMVCIELYTNFIAAANTIVGSVLRSLKHIWSKKYSRFNVLKLILKLLNLLFFVFITTT